MNDTIKINLRFVDGRPVTTRATCRLQAAGSSQATELSLSGGSFTGPLPLPTSPDGTGSFTVTVEGMEFWQTSEGFTVTLVGGRPLVLGGARWRRQEARGTASTTIAVELELVVLRLKDVTTTVHPSIADSFEVFDFDEDILGPFATTPAPAGSTRDNQLLDPETRYIDSQALRFYMWHRGRSTIGVYVPTSARPISGSYLFYFKPPKHADPVQTIAEVYLTGASLGFHQILASSELAETGAVICFLMGESGDPEVVANATTVSDILAEVDFILRGENPAIGSGVTSVALASFSEGGRLLNNVMGGISGSRLSGTLQAVFVLDSWFGEGKLEEFRKRLREWFNGGADDKVVRIYQGFTVTDPDLLNKDNTNAVRGPFGTMQKEMGHVENPYADSPSYYYLRMTDEFLQHHAARLMPQTDLHHAVPKLFLVHALKTTVL